MELILWRHAEAEDGIPDDERKLTAKGVKQARHMANWLKTRLPDDLVIVVSPAKRTLQTVHGLSADFRIVDAVGTSGSPASLLSAINWPHTEENILVVGHQPTLGETAALLLTGKKDQWHIKKGAVIWLTRHSHAAGVRAQLRAAISPKLL